MATTSPRCADVARSARFDPVGTAGEYDGFLLVDWPLPWPRDAADVEELAPVLRSLEGRRVRLQLVVPADPKAPSRVALYRRNAGSTWFSAYEEASVSVPRRDIVAASIAVLDWPTTGGGSRRAYVCTHGGRDRCCGSHGTALATRAKVAGLDVARTSHLGGHRFAPTCLILPEGSMWAFLDDDLLASILDRQGDVGQVLPHYRGCTSIGPPAAQAAERVAFGEVGWTWLDHRRRVVDLDAGWHRVESRAPDGAERSWEVEVVAGRILPVPDCGRPIEEARKSEAEVVVRQRRPADGVA